jgi:hypothetical protein
VAAENGKGLLCAKRVKKSYWQSEYQTSQPQLSNLAPIKKGNRSRTNSFARTLEDANKSVPVSGAVSMNQSFVEEDMLNKSFAAAHSSFMGDNLG